MTQLAVLDQASTSVSYTLSSIGWGIDLWPGYFSRMRNVYTALDTKNTMKDGETSFPRPGYEDSAGMSVELRYVDCIRNTSHLNLFSAIQRRIVLLSQQQIRTRIPLWSFIHDPTRTARRHCWHQRKWEIDRY